ncbi:MAG: SlyX family protein [Candidatus Omnitrophica bacterium]|nr:SlyX family protein [Candidatus Omnitrophota bacterium]
MDERVVGLEKKVSFLEKMVQELNGVVIDQEKKINRLEVGVRAMKDQMAKGDLVRRQEDEEPPPHY